jgi:predicted transglutaminase-like cysteine proteinase
MKVIASLAAAFVVAAMGLVVSASTSAAVESPMGFKIFCLKNPTQCAAAPSKTIELDNELMTKLKKVNSAVNRSIRPRHEPRGKDAWILNAGSGDCEDYAVTKRAKLMVMGVPAGALRIATAKTRSGEGHAVLIVITSQGRYVLDNRTGAIKPMSQSGLRFVSMSGANPRAWAAL